jgi:hypothetical protein
MKTHTTLLTAMSLIFSLHAYAQQCLPSASAHLDINNVDALIHNSSDKWMNFTTGVAGYEIPKGSGKTSMYAAALWIGGMDAMGNIYVSAETYRQTGTVGCTATGNNFWAGPVQKNNCMLSADTNNCPAYQHVWKFTKAEILNFISTGTATNDILTYPANGNAAAGELPLLAPFYDANANGTYEPLQGDYPLMDVYNNLPDSVDQLYGDECTYWIFNDTASVSQPNSPDALGIEVHAQAYAYLCPNPYINNATFYSYKIINRSCVTYDSVYIAHWADSDLGFYQDDFIGCHVGKNIGFCYNGDMDDDGPDGYGPHPPAVGVEVLQGPLADANDGIDNNNDGVIDEAGEECLMTSFLYFNNNADPIIGNPCGAQDYYNYMSGTWKNGEHMTYGGNGYNPGSTDYTNFMFPGISDPAHPSILWTEEAVGNQPDDRRFLVSSGSFTFYPDQSVTIRYAVPWARDTAGDNLSSRDSLLAAAEWIKNNFRYLDTLCGSASGIASPENSSAHSFQIVPNPAGEYCELRFTGTAQLSVTNILGEEVYNAILQTSDPRLATSSFADGIYIVKLSTKEGVFQRKLVIQH